jgi:cytochrome d ubiquinol oxidase subunit I
MSAETLARWQFGITTVYHFLFVPITIALSMLVAILQTLWYRSGEEKFLQLTKFYGKLFLINFAMGVVTGIVQEFQFGLNWSEYSRFVGDIFGAPLAMEALIAFFLESVFLGMWIFGWDRLPKKAHLTAIWLGASGTLISAIFILAANSWMQNPTGSDFNADNLRAQTDGLAGIVGVVLNPVNLATLPHVISGAWLTAGGVILGVAGWSLVKAAKAGSADVDTWRWATKFGAWVMIIAGAAVLITGDFQGKAVTGEQPIKMAAAEGLCASEKGAGFSLVYFGGDCSKGEATVGQLTVPGVFSFLGKGDVNATMYGLRDLTQTAYETGYVRATTEDGKVVADKAAATVLQKAQADAVKDYFQKNVKSDAVLTELAPSIGVTFWSFRIMMLFGFVGIAIGIWALIATSKGKSPKGGSLWTAAMIAAPLLPLFANSFGWIFAEMGRQPFIVYGVLPTAAAVSPGVSALEVGLTMVLFTLIYGTLAVVEVGLMLHFIKKGLPEVEEPKVLTDDDAPLSFAY